MLRIAHLSDIHVLELAGVPRTRLLLNKRFTGWVNLKLHRGSKHKRTAVDALVRELKANPPDHLVVTGDLTTLALEQEFVAAREVLEATGMSPNDVSVVPGNHDVYTRGSARSDRFVKYFGPYITSDIDLKLSPETRHVSGPFPFVRLRGDVAIVGVSTAVPRLPLVASGHAGEAQRDDLARVFALDEVRRRVPVVLSHHPWINPRTLLARIARGLGEAPKLNALLEAHARSMVLHGHLHDRAHRVVEREGGMRVEHLGATSASLIHQSDDRMAGFNVYEVDAGGLRSANARVWRPDRDVFETVPLPTKTAQHAD